MRSPGYFMSMTLREAMELLDLSERTLDSSMLESALASQLSSNPPMARRERLLEAHSRIKIFLDPSADERFLLRNSNVLVALSGEYAIPEEVRQAADPSQNSMLTQEIFILDENRDVLEAAPPPSTRGAMHTPSYTPSPDLNAPLLSGELLETESINPHQTFDESLLLAPQAETAANSPSNGREAVAEEITGTFTIEDEHPAPIPDAPIRPLAAQPSPKATRAETTRATPSQDTGSQNTVVQNATRSTSVHIGDGLDETSLPDPPPKTKSSKAKSDKEKTTPAAPKTEPRPVGYGFSGTPAQPDRRSSRSSKSTPVKRSYTDSDRTSVRPLGARKPKRKGQPWLWAIGLFGLIGAGVFATPGLLHNLANNTAPTRSVTTPKTPLATTVLTPVPAPRSSPPVKTAPVKPKATKPKATSPSQPKTTQAIKKTATLSTTKPATKKSALTPEQRAAAAKVNAVARREASSLPQIPGTPAAPRIPSAEQLPQISNPGDLKPTSKPKPAVKTASKPKNQSMSFKPPPIDPNNLSREQIGRQFLNQQYFENWFNQNAQLKYTNWNNIPIEIQVAPYPEFRAAVYLAPPPEATPSTPGEPAPIEPIPHSP
jgi:hypothetical protein